MPASKLNQDIFDYGVLVLSACMAKLIGKTDLIQTEYLTQAQPKAWVAACARNRFISSNLLVTSRRIAAIPSM